eukprot:3804327-Amphidinium_carterae.1
MQALRISVTPGIVLLPLCNAAIQTQALAGIVPSVLSLSVAIGHGMINREDIVEFPQRLSAPTAVGLNC